MNEIYWMIVLGKLANFSLILGGVIAFIGVVLLCGTRSDRDGYYKLMKDEYKKDMNKSMTILASGLFLILVFCFTPSRKDMYMIYGIGGTIDYIQSSDEAKKLPDNCIKAANKFVESYLDEEKGGGE